MNTTELWEHLKDNWKDEAIELGKMSAKRMGYLFYIVTPNTTSFEKMDQVPNYASEIVPFFATMIILEQAYNLLTGKKILPVHDTIGSLSQGMLSEMSKLLFITAQLWCYIKIYSDFRLFTLPWDSPWTWWLCFFGMDLGYYVGHRMCHEVNILWAAHQVHHSSEHYNLTTALRQPMMQYYLTWVFYLPMAFAIPPSIFLVHYQLNLIFQFWLHTESIDRLGPLEYILNTPSHHRVHHGRNRYCIDKNYAGVLIIWDRMFGTFEAEQKVEDEVVYGLTHNLNTFDMVTIQVCHYRHIWNCFWEAKGLKHKLSVLFKGPGWEPGKPRLGSIEDIPDVHAPQPKYDITLPLWCDIYVIVHFFYVVTAYNELVYRQATFSQVTVLASVAYLIFSMTSIGFILDKRSYSPFVELSRCLLYLTLDYYLIPPTGPLFHIYVRWLFVTSLRFVFSLSTVLWSMQCLRTVSVKIYSKKLD